MRVVHVCRARVLGLCSITWAVGHRSAYGVAWPDRDAVVAVVARVRAGLCSGVAWLCRVGGGVDSGSRRSARERRDVREALHMGRVYVVLGTCTCQARARPAGRWCGLNARVLGGAPAVLCVVALLRIDCH
jgi:hypothetical protein